METPWPSTPGIIFRPLIREKHTVQYQPIPLRGHLSIEMTMGILGLFALGLGALFISFPLSSQATSLAAPPSPQATVLWHTINHGPAAQVLRRRPQQFQRPAAQLLDRELSRCLPSEAVPPPCGAGSASNS